MEAQLNLAIEAAVPDSVGREKRLDDVLRACGDFWERNRPSCEQLLIANRWMCPKDHEWQYFLSVIIGLWQLGKPLSEQSDETVNFLHKLLYE